MEETERPGAHDATSITTGMGPAVDASSPDTLPLHPALRTIWRLRNLGFAVTSAVPATVLASALLPTAVAVVMVGLLTGSLMIFGWWHAGAAFARYRVHVLDDGVMVEHGVFWHSQTFVPGVRIQHTEVQQGPLDRRWGMAKLVIHTAAAGLAAVAAVGLHRDDAIAVRDRLVDRGHDAV